MAYLVTDRCLQLVLLIGIFTTGLHGSLTWPPPNTIQIAGEKVTLACSSNQAQNTIDWIFTPRGGENDTAYYTSTIVSGCKSQSPNYTTESNANGQCNLVINNLTLYHAGRYTCNDTTDARSAQLGVMTTAPRCALDSTDPVSEGHLVYIKYKLDYYGAFTAYVVIQNSESLNSFSSLKAPYSKYPAELYVPQMVDFTSGTSASKPRYPPQYCNTTFISDPATWPYKDAFNNASYQHVYVSPPVDVLYRPYLNAFNITGGYSYRSTIGTNVTCYVQANPPASYKWTDPAGNTTNGPVITLSILGNDLRYSCFAWNSEGNETTNYYVDVYNRTYSNESPGQIPSLSTMWAIICLSWMTTILSQKDFFIIDYA